MLLQGYEPTLPKNQDIRKTALPARSEPLTLTWFQHFNQTDRPSPSAQ
jgi:hypothetical protein